MFILKFRKHSFTCSYKNPRGALVEEDWEMHIRPIDKWIKDVVGDLDLADEIEWFPVSKTAIYSDGSERVFIDDIHCGSDLWETQVSLLQRPYK